MTTLPTRVGADPTHPYWTLTSANAAGAVTDAKRNGDAVTVLHLHDRATGALSEVQATGFSNTIAEESYTYDVWGNRKTRGSGLATTQSESYGYNGNNRLTHAVMTRSGTNYTTLDADYHPAGNFTYKTTVAGRVDYSYAAGNADRLASVSSAITGSFLYDAAGRITSGPDGLSASYNARGLAVSASVL